MSNFIPSDEQQAIAAAVASSAPRNIAVDAGAGCLAGDTIIGVSRGRKSYTTTIAQLHYILNGGTAGGKHLDLSIKTRVRSLLNDNIIGLQDLSASIYSGEKLTYTVSTEDGRSVRATADHRFFTPDGWVRLENLKVGDYLVVDGGKPKSSGIPRQERRKDYLNVSMLHSHPYSNSRGDRQGYVPLHRVVYEAHLNGLRIDDFLDRVRNSKIDGLQFVDTAIYHIHHRDEDTYNNCIDNLQLITAAEHFKHHANKDGWKHVQARGVHDKIKSIQEYGVEPTYDLTMANGDRPNFLANGIVVHNCGKTTTGVYAIREIIPPAQSVQVCAFNRKIKEEFQSRLMDSGRRGVSCDTFNGLGYKAMCKALGVQAKDWDLDDNKYAQICNEWAEAYFDAEEVPADERDDAAKMLERLVHFFMVNTTRRESGKAALCVLLGNDDLTNEPMLADHDPSDHFVLRTLCGKYGLGVEVPDTIKDEDALAWLAKREGAILNAVPYILKTGEQAMLDPEQRWVSFTEQIYWTVVKDWRCWQSMWVFADESQDMSALERALVDKHLWMKDGKMIGRIIIVGDPQQAIYRFKGADSSGFANSMRFWGIKTAYPLTLSRRCPKLIAARVQGHKPGYRTLDTAPDGEIGALLADRLFEMIQPGDACISRIRAPMIPLWRELMKLGKPAVIIGADISKSITNIIKTVSRHKGFTFDKLDDYLEAYAARKLKRMIKAKKKAQDIGNFNDQMAAVYGAVEACPKATSVDSLISDIQAIFRKDDGDDKDLIQIMTGHGCKGLEFQTVWNITPTRFPLDFPTMSSDEYEQELNLKYVVETRTQNRYYLVFADKDELDKSTEPRWTPADSAPQSSTEPTVSTLRPELDAAIRPLSEVSLAQLNKELDDIAIKHHGMTLADVELLRSLGEFNDEDWDNYD